MITHFEVYIPLFGYVLEIHRKCEMILYIYTDVQITHEF